MAAVGTYFGFQSMLVLRVLCLYLLFALAVLLSNMDGIYLLIGFMIVEAL